MINDVTMVWKGVVDRMFRDDERKVECVQGSTGDPSSVSGGGRAKGGTVPPTSPLSAGLESGSAVVRLGSEALWMAVLTSLAITVCS
jgi:hypothetical protein